MTEQAFSTSKPETVIAFLVAEAAGIGTVRAIVESAAALGKNKGALRSSGMFGTTATVGLKPDDIADPPDGWIYSKSKDMLVPRRGKAGNPAREWLDANQPAVNVRAVLHDHHGLPYHDLLGEVDQINRRFNVPQIFHHDGTLWALYQGTPGFWAGGAIEPTWTRRMLSEYYLAREGRDAASSVSAQAEAGQ